MIKIWSIENWWDHLKIQYNGVVLYNWWINKVVVVDSLYSSGKK
jgi:hypothetical protein